MAVPDFCTNMPEVEIEIDIGTSIVCSSHAGFARQLKEKRGVFRELVLRTGEPVN
jgi:hypothetical protein